jgi:PBP1b-binding outer membrane lipoprotein LpoB
MRSMFPKKSSLSFVHSGVLAILALSSVLLAGCASPNSNSSRAISDLPDSYATVFLAPVEVIYSGSSSLNAAVLARNTGIGFAGGLSEKGYTVVVTDFAVSDSFIAAEVARRNSNSSEDTALLEKLQNKQAQKRYVVLKNGALVDALSDVGEFRSGLKAGSYANVFGKVQILEAPTLPGQFEESRLGKTLVFNIDFEATDASGLSTKWTTRGDRGEVKSVGTAEALTSSQADSFTRQVLKELPEIQKVPSSPKPEGK